MVKQMSVSVKAIARTSYSFFESVFFRGRGGGGGGGGGGFASSMFYERNLQKVVALANSNIFASK